LSAPWSAASETYAARTLRRLRDCPELLEVKDTDDKRD
jgi:hypothetical protein